MTKDKIKEINNKCPQNQGIFFEPNGIPYKVKDKVIYMRWEVGGCSGAGYHEYDYPHYYTNERPNFTVLDLVIDELHPDPLTQKEIQLIENLIVECENNRENEDYYGNHENWLVEYIPLTVLETLLKTF